MTMRRCALLNADSAYFVPHFAVTWTIYWSGLTANVASRDIGAPQAVAAIESIIETVAGHLDLDPLEVRRRNCYGGQERLTTHFGQVISNNTLPVLIDRLAETAGYDRRREELLGFNKTSPSHLRGLALTPMKYGVAVTPPAKYDGNAQVNVDLDGTIRVAIGRPAMSRTFATMFRQRIADHFGVATETVRILTRWTGEMHTARTVPPPGVDLDGPAAFRACEMLRDRLAAAAARQLAEPIGDAPTLPGDIRFERSNVFDVRRPDRCLSFIELVGAVTLKMSIWACEGSMPPPLSISIA